MSHFCLLREPQNYSVEDWDLVADAEAREYWLTHFAAHIEEVFSAAGTRYGLAAKGRIAKARTVFLEQLQKLRAAPDSLPGGKLGVIDLCRLREAALRGNKINDPFLHIKQRENASAIALYPSVIERLDRLEPKDRWLHLVECIFAGNIFDLGSVATMKYARDGVDFTQVVEELPKRPWLVDQYDALEPVLPIDGVAQWAKAVIFVDNAGADFILGAMPLARALALDGVKIVLAANEQPSLNDMTIDETVATVEELAAQDDALADLIAADMFEVVSSGNDLPLIDLSNVSDELNAAAEGAELVILEGMGRAVESNFNAKFTCDVLRLAMLKDEAVARHIGGKNFDVVCKFDRP